MTASELCDAVETTIAFWRSMVPSGKNLQRVPEFKSEDQSRDERLKRANLNLLDASHADILFNLVHGCEPENNAPPKEDSSKTAAGFGKSSYPGSSGRINVTRIGQDARQLTAEEYRVYGPIIAKMRQNATSNSSTTGQPLAGNTVGGTSSGAPPGSSGASERQQVLLSSRSPLLNSLRQRQIPSGSLPPVPAEPAVAPVPVLEQESVLDLSSNSQRRRQQQQQIQDHLNATRNSALAPPTLVVQRTTSSRSNRSSSGAQTAGISVSSNSIPVLAMSLRGALERLNPGELARRGSGNGDIR